MAREDGARKVEHEFLWEQGKGSKEEQYMNHVVVRSTLRLGLLASLVVVVLSACGGGGAQEGGAQAGGESQATTEQTEAGARWPRTV